MQKWGKNQKGSLCFISSRRLSINFRKLKDCQPFPVDLTGGFYAEFYLWALFFLSAVCSWESASPFSLALIFPFSFISVSEVHAM